MVGYTVFYPCFSLILFDRSRLLPIYPTLVLIPCILD